MDKLNNKIHGKLYHVLIVKTQGKETYRGEKQIRFNISTITDAIPRIAAPDSLLTIESAPATEPDSLLAIEPPPMTEEQQPGSSTPTTSVEKNVHKEDKKPLQYKKTAKRSLAAEIAEQEQQFTQKIKSEQPSKSSRST